MSYINPLSAMQATSVASNALAIYEEIKPDVTDIVYYTAAISAVALLIYQCKTNLDDFLTHSKNKDEHADKLNLVLEELKNKAEHAYKSNLIFLIQDYQKERAAYAALTIQNFYRKNKKSKSTFQKLSLFIKKGVKSMMKAFSKFGRFVFKTLPLRVSAVVFRSSLHQKHAYQLYPVLVELKCDYKKIKKSLATGKKPNFDRTNKDTHKVSFEDEVKTTGPASRLVAVA
ncbi:MAG: hypothetical protein VX737_05870 [Pseudomonadota bacterium]|nr:hypothetical protein [Pseudomonadota bacterium]